MNYNVEFSREALTSLSRLNKQVAQRVLDRIKWLSLRIEDVLLWALSGIFTDEERKALASGR